MMLQVFFCPRKVRRSNTEGIGFWRSKATFPKWAVGENIVLYKKGASYEAKKGDIP